MTDTNSGWGSGGSFVLGGVLGGLAGYALSNNRMPYGPAAFAAAGGVTGYGEGCDIARANARIDNIISQNAQNEVINAIAGVNANVSQSAKDIYQTEIQNLLAEQASQHRTCCSVRVSRYECRDRRRTFLAGFSFRFG